jgi:CelD/BcsL family acetyltransferase involved in cellulose biosynthesis
VRDSNNELLAVAPMMITHRPGISPVRVRALQFFGSDPNITEIRGPLCKPGVVNEAMDAIRNYLARFGSNWDWIHWSGLLLEAEASSRPDQHLQWRSEIPDYFLPLPADWEQFRSNLSRNIKESLRKCYNSLKRDGHNFEFTALERPEEVSEGLKCFFELHRARSAVTDTVQHPDVFASDSAQAFLTEYAETLARRGQLRIFQLRIGGEIVATRVGFLFGDELYLYYSGYRPEWGRYSVMTTLVAEAIKWAIQQKLSIVNLSSGEDPSKLRWHPQEVRFAGGIQLPASVRGQLAFGIYKQVLRQTRATTPLRRLLARAMR